MPHDEADSEWLTRKQRIDPLLDAIGWPKAGRSMHAPCRVEEYETGNGPGDYALCEDFDVSLVLERQGGTPWELARVGLPGVRSRRAWGSRSPTPAGRPPYTRATKASSK